MATTSTPTQPAAAGEQSVVLDFLALLEGGMEALMGQQPPQTADGEAAARSTTDGTLLTGGNKERPESGSEEKPEKREQAGLIAVVPVTVPVVPVPAPPPIVLSLGVSPATDAPEAETEAAVVPDAAPAPAPEQPLECAESPKNIKVPVPESAPVELPPASFELPADTPEARSETAPLAFAARIEPRQTLADPEVSETKPAAAPVPVVEEDAAVADAAPVAARPERAELPRAEARAAVWTPAPRQAAAAGAPATKRAETAPAIKTAVEAAAPVEPEPAKAETVRSVPAAGTAVTTPATATDDRKAAPVTAELPAKARVDDTPSRPAERPQSQNTVEEREPAAPVRAVKNSAPAEQRTGRQQHHETATPELPAQAQAPAHARPFAAAAFPDAAAAVQSPAAEPATRPAQVLESTPQGITPASDNAPARAPEASTHEISLKLSTPHEPGVQVRFVERDGEVRVAVRTSDQGLAQSLREDLGNLTRALDARGYQSETWQPATVHASSAGEGTRDSRSGNDAHTDPRDAWSGQSGSGHQGSGGERRRQQQNQPSWLDELNRSGEREQSIFRSFLK